MFDLKERPRQAAAFLAYCEMGPMRSLEKLAKRLKEEALLQPGALKVTLATLEKWSSKHSWVERVKLYDAARAEEKRVKRDAEREKMDDQHAILGSGMAMKAIRQIDELIKKGNFGAIASVNLLKISTDLERIARGVPNQQIDLQVSPGDTSYLRNVVSLDLSKLSNEQLLQLETVIGATSEQSESSPGYAQIENHHQWNGHENS